MSKQTAKQDVDHFDEAFDFAVDYLKKNPPEANAHISIPVSDIGKESEHATTILHIDFCQLTYNMSKARAEQRGVEVTGIDFHQELGGFQNAIISYLGGDGFYVERAEFRRMERHPHTVTESRNPLLDTSGKPRFIN